VTTVLLPGVNIQQLAQFVEKTYSEYSAVTTTSTARGEVTNTCTATGEEQRIAEEQNNSELKEELKLEEDDDFEDLLVDDDDDVGDVLSEDSDCKNGSSMIAYKLAEMINSGKFERLAEEEFIRKRSIFPAFFKIDKDVICKALESLKVQFLKEKHKCTELEGKKKYQISSGICPYEEKNPQSLIVKHLLVHFNMFLCTVCDKTEKAIKTPEPSKTDSVWVCDICNKSLKTEYNLSLHKKSHDNVHCEQCNYTCQGRKRLQSHVNRKHGETKESHVCHVCSKSLSTSQQLKSHLQIHGDAEFKCKHCDKLFKVEKNLKKHIIMHHREKKFICEWCGKSFSLKCHHDQHVVIKHTKNKNFKCPNCGYQGATKYYLQKHMESHEEAKLCCSHCGKTFRQPGALKFHTMTHTGERPYACPDCTYRCIQPYDLRKHFKTKHNKVLERPSLYISPASENEKE